MIIQLILVISLSAIALLGFFVAVPPENVEIVKMIITAFIAFLTGAATGYAMKGNKHEKDNPVDSRPSIL